MACMSKPSRKTKKSRKTPRRPLTHCPSSSPTWMAIWTSLMPSLKHSSASWAQNYFSSFNNPPALNAAGSSCM